MNTRIANHVIIMLLSVIVGGMLAKYLKDGEHSKNSISPGTFSTGLAGFNKFAADIQWMLFVNYSGNASQVNNENAQMIYRKLKAITANDPGMAKAYEVGALMISVQEPVKAVEILREGCKVKTLSSNWKIPFYAGFIIMHNYPDKESDKALGEAEKFYKTAVLRSGGAEKYVVSQYLNVKALKIRNAGTFRFEKNTTVKVSSDRQSRMLALFADWKENRRRGQMGSSSQPLQAGQAGPEITGIFDHQDAVLRLMQSAVREEPGNSDIMQTISLLRSEMFADKHLCDRCISPYGAGDKFCSCCGTSVTVYGLCPKCSYVLKGRYCTSCGADGAPPAPPAVGQASKN